MQFVIDYDPLVLDRPQIIGTFESWEEADQWGRRNITTGAWHVMPLTDAKAAATALSGSSRTLSATHV